MTLQPLRAGSFPANVLLRMNRGEPLASYQDNSCFWTTILGYGKSKQTIRFVLIKMFEDTGLIEKAPYDVGYFRFQYVLTDTGKGAVTALSQGCTYQPILVNK